MEKCAQSILLIIDIQGKLADLVHESDRLIKETRKLIEGAHLLDVPIYWVEQYPEGLGRTKKVLRDYLVERATYFSKRTFSAWKHDSFKNTLQNASQQKIVVVGIESHVCVYQTVKDLLQQGFDVEIVVDAISSRTVENKRIGIEKMRSLGAQITSVEMILFEWMETSEHKRFKEVSAIIK